MPRRIRAAVLYEPNRPMAVEEVDLDEPRAGEVLVRIGATGVCHSDYHVIKGEWSLPLPMVLGHEAAGVVEAVGPGVTLVKPGDHVILNFRAHCGRCYYCNIGRPVLCDGIPTPRWVMFDGTTRLSKDGRPIYHMARVASFAEYAVVPETGAVPVRKDVPLDRAALIGCAVMTGVGAVVNTARVPAGSSVAVIGCGGVGLNVIQGAALVGADPIIAIDVLESKLGYAREFGATHTVDASQVDPVAEVRRISGGGVDFAFEAIGNGRTIRQAYELTRPGGVTVVVGMAPEGEEVAINALSLPRTEKVIMGCWYGSARPWVDLPRMAELYLAGKIKVDPLISRHYRLEEINAAFEALGRGELKRGVIVFGP